MPHVVVRLHAGRSVEQKKALADAVTKAVTRTLKLGEESVSVGIEDVEPRNWTEQVYRPDILGKMGTIYKKPGYEPH